MVGGKQKRAEKRVGKSLYKMKEMYSAQNNLAQIIFKEDTFQMSKLHEQ